MVLAQKIKKLETLLARIESITPQSTGSPQFTAWKDDVHRTLTKIYGSDSLEVQKFQEVQFHFSPGIWFPDADYSQDFKAAYLRGLAISQSALETYISELKEEQDAELALVPIATSVPSRLKQVFISHASADAKYAEEIVELLRLMGLQKSQIFCTSVQGYGIKLGKNFLQELKERISDDVLVLFLFSENFFSRPICHAELGATWVLSKEHVPIVIPPFRFSDIEGALPHTQGLEINNGIGMNELAETVENFFGLPNYREIDDWERVRNKIIRHIESSIAEDAAAAKDSPSQPATRWSV